MSSSGVNLENFLIPLEEINLATENFSPKTLIGNGGYGKVYRGQLSERWQNRTAAIKRLSPTGYQGEHEFQNELEMISRFNHQNIIPFIGYCDEGNEMIIVYEFAVNGSLDCHLQDPNKRRCITWAQRLQICIGAARGLEYLHSGLGEDNRVIHRDIKSANILLDDNLDAKISDFGLSRSGPRNQPYTQVYTSAAGTHFYLDPLYLESSILRKESDVYSFGVVLFEMLSGMLVFHGRRIGDDEPRTLISLVRRYYDDGLDKLIDPHIKDQIDSRSFHTFKEIAYNCISFNLKERPTMDRIIERIQEALDIQNADHVYDSNRVNIRFKETADDNYFQPHNMHDEVDSFALEDGPGIEGFQIIGVAKPGGRLLGCGFEVRGTSLCLFEWVRHLQNGTWEYIEGATNPEYVVTADDVDKLIAVECIPMDDQGRQGKMVRLFANEQNKVTCDPEMQQEIDKYMSVGQASFTVLLLLRFIKMDSSENWEQTTLSLRRSNYQIKINRTQEIFIQGEYSNDLSIKIPSGLTTLFVLTCSDGSSHRFNTFHDVRMRDTLVLTMRMFQSKALDERRKTKA